MCLQCVHPVDLLEDGVINPPIKILSLLYLQIRKSPQIAVNHVGDSPEFESITNPMQNMIAVFGETLRGCIAVRFRRPNEQVDKMLITLVDERRYLPAIYIIQPTSDQAEAAVREILNWWGEFELSVKPRLNRMLIGRRNIEKVRGEQGANVTGDHFLCERVVARAIKCGSLIEENQPEHNGERRRQGQWNGEPGDG